MKIKQLPSAVSLLLTVMLLATSAPSHAQQADPEVRARQVLDRMVNGKFSEIEAQYDSAMKSALPPGKLAEVWGQLNDQIGSFKKVTGARHKFAGDPFVEPGQALIIKVYRIGMRCPFRAARLGSD